MRPIDYKQRLQAIDPGQSFIIQAPAGSGKTELLTQRYLRLLTLVDSPEEIIAVTFTRKAAAEMQGRILAAIEAVRTGQRPQDEHRRQTWELAEAVLKHDAKHDWDIRANPARLRIQTIDALCAWLSGQMPVPSSLGAQPEIVDDAEPLYEQAAINTLAELENGGSYADAIACLLLHLDNDLPRIKRLIVDMLKKRDQWLPHVAQVPDRSALEQSLQNIIEEQLAALARLFPHEVEAELCGILRFAAGNLQRENGTHSLVNCASIETIPGDRIEDLEQWAGIVKLLLTDKDDWRKSFDKRNGFPAPKGKTPENRERADMKERIADLINQLKPNDELRSQLAEIKILPAASYDDEEWQTVNALCIGLVVAEAQLRLCFAEHSQIDYIGMAQAAICALGKEDAPTDLALHLDYQIKHILVDEFQDISINQYRLIRQLTEGWTQDEGRSLFLVGDPMQSIYRFRQAEVGLFINTYRQQHLGQIELVPLQLSVNFRSLPGVVDWVNTSFAEILPDQDDALTGAVRYMPSMAQDNPDGGAVNCYPLFTGDGAEEAEQVRNILETIRQQDPDASIAILVRSRSHLNELVPLLRRQDLPFRAIEIEALGQRPAIQDILALTRAYIHLADRTAWLAVLRAPWCGLSLQDMHTLVNRENRRTVWQAINAPKQQLDKQAALRLQKLIENFREAFNNQQRQPLRKTIETLWMRLGGPATLAAEHDMENINTYLELLEQFDRGGELNNPPRFMDEVQKLYAAPDKQAGDTLQIMTIHKAKGLEFDHVIVPGLGRGQKRGQAELLAWMLRSNGQQPGNDLLLAPIKESGEETAPIYNYIDSIEKRKKHHEETRLLYVAGTRAAKSLHLIGHAECKQDNEGGMVCAAAAHSLLSHLWPVLRQHYEAELPEQIEAGMATDIPMKNNALYRIHPDWRSPLPDKPLEWANKQQMGDSEQEYDLVEYQWAGETIKHVGLVVHQCLRQIAEEGVDTWNEARIGQNKERFVAMLKQQGIRENEIAWADIQIAEALNKIVQDERGRWILSDHEQQNNEYPLSGLYEGKLINIIIDRTFVDEDGVRWIIDYKTSRHEGADVETFLNREQERYRGQLEKYAGLIQAMDSRQIRLGLYFPLLQGWRAWSFG